MNTRDGESESDLPPPVPSETGEAEKWSAPTPPIPSDETSQSPGVGANLTPDRIPVDDPFAHFDPPRNPDERGRFAGYRILGLLGSGGMGLVYEAEDPVLRRRVALKVLRPEIAGLVVRARFLREAQMAASLKDDHVVTIYQVGEEGGRPYLVMERLHGESLEDKLKRERWLPISEALRIAVQIAKGLRAAHSVGLVHRDIKPANIWLEHRPDRQEPPRVKILDFGLAKPLLDQSGLTQEGFMVGTPAYIAPEQLEGRPIDPRSDLYALGIVMYRMIAGVPPFEAPSIPKLMAAILEANPAPVSSIRLRVPRPVEELLGDLMAKDPSRRPPNAAAVIERIRAIEDHAPPTVRADSIPEAVGVRSAKAGQPGSLDRRHRHYCLDRHRPFCIVAESAEDDLRRAARARFAEDRRQGGPER